MLCNMEIFSPQQDRVAVQSHWDTGDYADYEPYLGRTIFLSGNPCFPADDFQLGAGMGLDTLVFIS